MLPIEKIAAAFKRADAVRPLKGGFPYMCAALKDIGVTGYDVLFPSTAKVFFMTHEGRAIALTVPGTPIAEGPQVVPVWDEVALLKIIKADQEHHAPGDLPKLLARLYAAGTMRYEVRFHSNKVTCEYFGGAGERYTESFVPVTL